MTTFDIRGNHLKNGKGQRCLRCLECASRIVDEDEEERMKEVRKSLSM